jgi:5-formyltetrahydrofolate cyclo-ligase
MRARRDATSGRQRILAAEAVAAHLRRLPVISAACNIAGYVACNGEIALHRVADAVLARGHRWLLPVVVDKAAPLRFVPWRQDSEMRPNRFGIPEPTPPFDEELEGPDLDVVLAPLLAFDRIGHRLGAGGGYYDRSLSHLIDRSRPSKPVLVGVAWAFQEAPLVPETWDVRLDWVVTENELIQCQD